MEALGVVLLVLRVVALLGVLVALLVQAPRAARRTTGLMRDGAGLAFLAGLLRVPVRQAADQDVHWVLTLVSLVIGLLVLVVVTSNLPRTRIPPGLWVGLVVLTLLDVALAVL